VPLTGTSVEVPHESLRALDTLLGSGGRVLFHTGLLGGGSFLIPASANPNQASPVYPNKDTWRVVARQDGIPLTPGSFPWLEVVAIPSGPQQWFGVKDAVTQFWKDGAGGIVELEIEYVNGDAETVTATISTPLAAANYEHNAEPPAPYSSLLVRQANGKPQIFQQLADAWWYQWTRGLDVLVNLTLRYRGSPRPIDVAVVERPLLVVTESTDGRWPTAMCSEGQPLEQGPSPYPIQQIAGADPALGTESIRRALYGHGRLLGPCLAWWSSATEHVGALSTWISYHSGTGDDEAPAWTMTGTTPTLLGSDALTTESDDNFGWRLGHYARQAGHGDDFLDGRTGVLPVWISAWLKVSGGTGTITVKTDSVGWGDVVLTTASTSYVLVEVPAWLEVGAGPEDAPVARAWVRNSGANTVSVRNFRIDFRQA
jgi:hypothetical protein